MDIRGISPSRPSQSRPDSRESSSSRTSISLEDNTFVPEDLLSNHQDTQPRSTPPPYNPAKSPLLLFQPQETYFTTQPREPSPEDGCPRLPSVPSSPSTPSVTNPMELYLQDDNPTENRMVRLQAMSRDQLISHLRPSSPKQVLAQSLSDESSWQMVDKTGNNQTCTSLPPPHPRKGYRIGELDPLPQLATPQNKTFEKMPKLDDFSPESSQSAWKKVPESPGSGVSDLCLSAGPSVKRHRDSVGSTQVDEADPTRSVMSSITGLQGSFQVSYDPWLNGEDYQEKTEKAEGCGGDRSLIKGVP
ncbi:hypothetical protein B0J13DRAFT_521970 [Dactylonectria estremocensis]|uniref:Uncharacterized protein n=1 Tax=Dactylonectria estremocensis TaxID=1079267 RepID=A0A9P9JF71_9HYPO|nr:hypothetical protein B0J13DRAFT_521970 [Dactylonectria estremocensis]